MERDEFDKLMSLLGAQPKKANGSSSNPPVVQLKKRKTRWTPSPLRYSERLREEIANTVAARTLRESYMRPELCQLRIYFSEQDWEQRHGGVQRNLQIERSV